MLLRKIAQPHPLTNPSTGYMKYTLVTVVSRRRTIAKVLDIGKFCTLIAI